PYEHRLQPNKLERLLFRKHLPAAMPGPKEHYWADVVNGTGRDCTKGLPKRGLEKRIEATDGWAACVTRDILTHDAARMVLFYLHENDHRSHRKGPDSQVDNLATADKHLAYVLETFGSWEETCERVGFIMTSDHSQSPISSESDHIIDLCEVLDGLSCVEPGRGKEPFGRKDLAVCGNGRVGFIYLNEARRERLRPAVIDALSEHVSIDQIMWRDGDDYVVRSPRGELRFSVADGDGVVDERDNKWAFEGDLDAVTGVVEGNDLRTPEYPLALWRIKGALDLDRVGDIVVTPKLTYEFTDLAGGHHKGGGDHASLHAQDSLIPFLSTLADPPLHPTTVDVVPHIVSHFERA
ncbi:MAG: alkaline phosphatase family protein, partial [Actinomycetota bacterium]|nr:alkaline phosphatase family protein [Actinomycetota bacterium]